MVDPTWVIDEELESTIIAIENVVQLESGVRGVVAPLRIANPLAVGQRRETVVGLVESTDLVGVEGAAQHKKAAQIELEVLKRSGCRHAWPMPQSGRRD